jgi:hypothetical protein
VYALVATSSINAGNESLRMALFMKYKVFETGKISDKIKFNQEQFKIMSRHPLQLRVLLRLFANLCLNRVIAENTPAIW